MVREQNQLRLASPLETEPTFSTTLRGYNRREVDHYAHIAETQLHAAIGQRDELAARIRTLTDQLHQAHTELVELRRRPKLDDKVSFRHLGPRVEQILAEAEQQADAVRAAAAESLNNERAALAAERAKVGDEFNRMVREYESGQQARRADEEIEIAKRLEAVRVEVADGQSYARKVRAEAEEIISAAQAEARRLITEATTQAASIRGDVTEQVGVLRVKAERDAAAIAVSAEQYARETREEAEQHAHQTRASAEQHARQVTAAAEQAATQLRLQAEQHAAQVRSAAEKHASRLHAFGPSSTMDGEAKSSLPEHDGAAAPTSPAVPASPAPGPGSPGNPVAAPRATADGSR